MTNLHQQTIIESQAVRDFVASAEEYCSFIENHQTFALKQFVWKAADVLSTLYKTALVLPDVETNDELDPRALLRRKNEILKDVVYPRSGTALEEIREKLGSYDVFRVVFNPYDSREPIQTSLAMGLVETYDDIKEGLILFNDGADEAIQAIWDWKFGLLHHWGPYHAVELFKPLNWIMQEIDSQETILQAQDDDE